MTDQYREPIDEDIDLRAKFVGGGDVHFERPSATTERATEKGGAEKASTYNTLLARVQKNAAAGDDDGSNTHAHTVVADAHRGAAQPDVESQVTHLVKLATTKGVVHAVKVAQHMSDYYILDKMHDKLLADQFFEELSKKGLV